MDLKELNDFVKQEIDHNLAKLEMDLEFDNPVLFGWISDCDISTSSLLELNRVTDRLCKKERLIRYIETHISTLETELDALNSKIIACERDRSLSVIRLYVDKESILTDIEKWQSRIVDTDFLNNQVANLYYKKVCHLADQAKNDTPSY